MVVSQAGEARTNVASMPRSAPVRIRNPVKTALTPMAIFAEPTRIEQPLTPTRQTGSGKPGDDQDRHHRPRA
jgi:hypothetical protein